MIRKFNLNFQFVFSHSFNTKNFCFFSQFLRTDLYKIYVNNSLIILPNFIRLAVFDFFHSFKQSIILSSSFYNFCYLTYL